MGGGICVGTVEKTKNIVGAIDCEVASINQQVSETYNRLLSLNNAILGGNRLDDSIKEDRPDLSGYLQLHLQKLGDISRQLVEVSKLLKTLEEQFLKISN